MEGEEKRKPLTVEEFAERLCKELDNQSREYAGALASAYDQGFHLALACLQRAIGAVLGRDVAIRPNEQIVGRTGVPGRWEVR